MLLLLPPGRLVAGDGGGGRGTWVMVPTHSARRSGGGVHLLLLFVAAHHRFPSHPLTFLPSPMPPSRLFSVPPHPTLRASSPPPSSPAHLPSSSSSPLPSSFDGISLYPPAPSESLPIPDSIRAEDVSKCSSPKLLRWARSRRIRSVGLSERRKSPSAPGREPSPTAEETSSSSCASLIQAADGHVDDIEAPSLEDSPGNIIYIVSDGTGSTAEHCVHAALGQFEHCLVDQGCPVYTHLFSQVNDMERLVQIIRDAGKENATLVYTLADPALSETAKKACQLYGITYLDLLGPITELFGAHMGVAPLGLPRGAPGRKMALSRQYFKRIEAVEFTIKQDDGALPQNLHRADLVLVGVSRTSKTPLSIYMAQKGYKVANVPLVLGIEPPKELFEIDQSKIYALTINPNFLHSLRTTRSETLGISSSIFYNDLGHIKAELEYSNKLFMENPKWPVVEVTGKAIEETAVAILRIYHDREKKHLMPRISHRY